MGGVKHPYFIPLNPGTQLGISMAGVHSMKRHTRTFNEGSIVVRAHASRAEGLRFEPDSMP